LSLQLHNKTSYFLSGTLLIFLQFQSLFLQIKVKKSRSFIILLIQANGRNFVQKYLAYMKLPVITIF